MFTGFGSSTSTPDNVKQEAINNIITLVRATQASNIPIDYNGLLNAAIAAAGPNDPEIAEVTQLLSALQSSNPYLATAAQEEAAEVALGANTPTIVTSAGQTVYKA